MSADEPVRAYLGLGSNVGDRLSNIRRAVELLGERDGVSVGRTSSIYETEPVGPPQPDFLNAVVEAATTLSARELLRACLDVEAELGRVRQERWGPRTIDIDLLIYDDERIDEPDLTVPHPRMHERAFVLVPLAELAPGAVLSDGRTARDAATGSSGVRSYDDSAQVDRAIVEGYRAEPQTDDEVRLASAATEALIQDEPW